MAGFDLVRELWLRRTLRASKTAQGAPPLSFTAKAGTLENYRIYGNTVGGESVGDETANLFDEESTKIPGFIDNRGYINTSTVIQGGVSTYGYIECSASTSYYLRAFAKADPSSSSITQRVAFFDGNKVFISRQIGASSFSFTTPENCSFIRLSLDDNYQNIVLMQGSTEPTEFIPYGYKVAVTVTNGTNTETTNIYLDEPLGKSGDDTDYIDYKTQKRYNIDGTSEDVTLPEITVPAGTDTLSVGTTVQPSKVKIKYKKG